MKSDVRPPRPARQPPLLRNWTSLSGMILAAGSFFAAICLVALDFFRGFTNPYVGVLTYLIAPVFLAVGLGLTAAGMLWEHHRRRRHGAAPPGFPRIDLNVPRQRHVLVGAVGAGFVFLLLTALGSFRTYQFTESVTFCGQTCHPVMTPESTAYRQSPHARVPCVDCHIGPGASWYVRSKLSGAYQVYATLVDAYPRPIPAPIEHLRPIRATCEQCHWPRKFFGAVERQFHHYLPDEKNSPWTVRMLVNVGGGDPGFGTVGGIHWHMLVANKIEFIARDEEQQDIPWVRLTDSRGNATVYESSDDPLEAEKVAAATPHTMDCVDCHNRPTHIYRSPVDAVDTAMATGRIDASIPHIKQQAVEALTGEYATTEDATRGISKALESYYRSDGSASGKPPASLVDQAVRETQNIYRQNFFPAMKVDWRVYPDNLRHWDFPGCFRCHDGNHTSSDGKTITHDCNACHTIVAQGPPGKLETRLSGLKFEHPVDIAGMWEDSNCSDCHDGAQAE